MKATPSTIDEYISSFPKETQAVLKKIRATIHKVVPDAEETISYAIPTFKLNGNYLVYFAAFKNHIGFYATPTGHEKFIKELSHYKQGKGSVQFPLDEPMPYDLINRIVKFRMQENAKKAQSKSTKGISPAKKSALIDQKSGNNTVANFLTELKHPLRKEIEQLRKVILKSNKGLTEVIKWNAPSFCFNGNDRITMRIHPPTQLQLIFHRGAKVLKQPKEKLIQDDTGILSWKTNDRAVATFTKMKDIRAKTSDLTTIVKNWLKAAR